MGSKLSPVESGKITAKTKTTAPNKKYKIHGQGNMASVDYFERKLDDKRRLTIPAELRAEFTGGVVITRGFQNYLHLYAEQVWETDVEAALTGNILDERVADLNVQFRTGKTATDLDEKQGRITIEQHLLDYAGIQRDIIAVRAGKYWRITAA